MSHLDAWLQRLGIPEMDADHQHLVAIANRADELAMRRSFLESDLPDVIAELKAHFSEHFVRKEAFMNSIGYPDEAQHRWKYHEIVAGLNKIVAAAHTDEHVALTLRVFMITWLAEHLPKPHTQFAAFISDSQGGFIPNAA